MTKLIKITKLRVFFVLLSLLAVAFGVYNIVWFTHVRKFDAFLDSAKLNEIKAREPLVQVVERNGKTIELPIDSYSFHERKGWKYYEYRDFETDYIFIYYIAIPTYLRFEGHVQAAYESDKYYINLILSPKDWEYCLLLGEQENLSDGYNAIIPSFVDSNGNPLERHPDQSEENYREWLALYAKYNEEIMEFFAKVNEAFGEALRQ